MGRREGGGGVGKESVRELLSCCYEWLLRVRGSVRRSVS